MVNKYIENNKQNIIDSIINCVSFESVSIKGNDLEAPFGKECKKALEYVLNLGKEMGFKTKNVDGYCAYSSCGGGEEMLGMIGHVDVVPAHI